MRRIYSKRVYTSKYVVRLTFCLARVRLCTLPSAKPRLPRTARISAFTTGERANKGRGNYSLARLRASSPYGVWAEPIGVQPTKKQP